MEPLSVVMTAQHRDCDRALAEVELAVHVSDWKRAESAMQRFIAAMLEHLAIEEDILFPAFEQATGVVAGPTQVMRADHGYMRGLCDELQSAAAAHDGEQCLAVIDTLALHIQQHNMKEEGVLYPACDAHVTDPAVFSRIVERTERFKTFTAAAAVAECTCR